MRSNDDVNNKTTESLNYNQQIYSFYFLDIPRLVKKVVRFSLFLWNKSM